jgi:hypothetical protein
MARIKDLVVDCHHPASLARFWAAVLRGYAVAPYEEAELNRLRQLGITSVEDDPSVLVEAEPGDLRLFFQQVPESKVVKNRIHIDLEADDLDADLALIVSLGGQVTANYLDHVLLMDPEGNEFCIFH